MGPDYSPKAHPLPRLDRKNVSHLRQDRQRSVYEDDAGTETALADPNTLKANVTDTLTVGYTTTSYSDGTVSTNANTKSLTWGICTITPTGSAYACLQLLPVQ